MSASPLLLFYPTSPVHVSDLERVLDRLPGWHCAAIFYQPLNRVAPGIDEAIRLSGKMSCITLDEKSTWESNLPATTKALMIGAAFEPFALELVAWAKLRQIPVMAIEEVAQLALNQYDINNYDAPFDCLFVASPDERRRFLDLGYPADILRLSGLLANDRFNQEHTGRSASLFDALGIPAGSKPIVYTTSPFRSRLALHNKDDQEFREQILNELANAARRTSRKVVVKLHPNENLENNRQFIKKHISNAIVIGREISMHELLPVSGVIVNRGNSQTCLDAVLRGVPTVVAACGLRTLFHRDGGAYIVEHIDTLASSIEDALTRGPLDRDKVNTKYFYLPPDGVASYIAEEITRISAKPTESDEHSWQWLIKSMLFVGRLDRALALAEKLPSYSAWQDLVRRALHAHGEHRTADTIRLWNESAALDPTWYFPHYELAHGYRAIGQYEKAIEHADKAITLHPPFHSLWHELPMRVVVMAALRSTGKLAAANMELRNLADRGLVEIVPELLIEAAAQHGAFPDQTQAAENCLDKALEQLRLFPGEAQADGQILARIASQHIDLAKIYVDRNELFRSEVSIARAMECVRSDTGVLNQIACQLGDLGELEEKAAHYRLADHWYSLALKVQPDVQWANFRRSRIALRQGHLAQCIQGLWTIAKIPNAPKAVVENVLSPAGTARLTSCWPASPTSIVKPVLLCVYVCAWFCRSVMPRQRDLSTSAALLILIWLFVGRHFVRRLRTDLWELRNLFYRLR